MKKPIHIKASHEGKLHKALGVSSGKSIPLSKERAAKHSKSPAERKEATFAANARKWK